MDNYYPILLKSPLFRGIAEKDLASLLSCLQAHTKEYLPDSYIFTTGDEINLIGIILEGQIEIVKESLVGSRNIIAFLGPSHLFGEGVVCTTHRISPVSARTKTSSKILFIPYERITKSCSHSCAFHIHLIQNMLGILGDKNYTLNIKMELLLLKGMREKLTTYLLGEAQRSHSLSFHIKPNRNELAEYLNVSRPSMCRELARMKDEGLIDYYQNSFKLINLEELKNCLSS